MTLRGVNLPGISYPAESWDQFFPKISPGYDSLASLSPQGIIPWRVYLPRVSYPDESISPEVTHDLGESTAIS